mmetsp:Transcript_5875/g.8690  ORF Transcript_5875/g.8690 Transcript_5875/m.8690 type:complete len:120 (+) Transcript_5875:47-406(+)
MVLATLRHAALASARGPSFKKSGVCLIQARMFAERTGTVKFFSPERGFGFISSEDNDYFVHYSGIVSEGGFKSLGDGEEVEFDVEQDRNGKLRAVRVTGPGGAPVKGTDRPRPNNDDRF